MIKFIAFILKYGNVTQDCKTMSKSFGDEKLTMIVFCQFYGYMLTICRTALTNIYGHIKHCPLYTAD